MIEMGVLAIAVLVAAAVTRPAFTAERDLHAYRLTFPRSVRPEQALAFARSISGLLSPWWSRWLFGSPAVMFEVAADADGIEHRLIGPRGATGYLRSQLTAAIPGIRIEEIEMPGLHPSTAAELRLSSGSVSLRTDQPESTNSGILATLQPLREGEQAVVQWMVTPVAAGRLRGRVPLPSVLAELALAGGRVQARLPIDDARAEREKRSEPMTQAICRLGVRAGNRARERYLLRGMLGAFHAGNAPGVAFRQRLLPDGVVASRITDRDLPGSWPAQLNAKELSAFLGLPLGDIQVPGLSLGATRQLAPSADIPRRGRIVGRSTFPGAERQLALSVKDSLRHLQVIGPTGVGKSTLLLNLIAGDMQAGRGVVVLDPKGDLATDVLARVPANRVGDVILLDPSDTAQPVGFNLLAGNHTAPELVVDQVVSIFRGLFSAFWGPRTDDVLRASLLTLTTEPGMTLAEVPMLLGNESFRRRLVGRLDDVVLEGFWSWYEALSPGERAQAIGPVLNKLRTFLLRKRLRNVIGQTDSTFSMEEVLSGQKILIVSLQKGLLGEDAAALLGSCVLARLWQAVQGRAALPSGARRPVFAYVDEFQDYLNLPTSLADVLAQARSYGLGLTLAHQGLYQLPPSVRQAVLINSRSRVVFQTAASDAAALAKEFAPYLDVADLQALGPYEAIFAAAAGNRVAPPATMTTLPASESTGQERVVRRLSRQRYGRDAAEVEAAMRERMEGGRPVGAVKRRRRP
jgi:Type IV secretion-system coupling protein DNA-binding domain